MTEPTKIYQFAPSTMASLEKQCPAPGVNHNTTPQEAGFLLGIQFVLNLLRKGFYADPY